MVEWLSRTSSILDLAVGEVGEVPLERHGTAGYAWEVHAAAARAGADR